jgi:hypothetical protein
LCCDSGRSGNDPIADAQVGCHWEAVKRGLAIFAVFAAAVGMGALAWYSLISAGRHASLSLQFESKSRFSVDEVTSCLEDNKDKAFSDFAYISISRTPNYLYRDYVGRDGSELSISQEAGYTMLRLQSLRAISSIERDILKWCSDTPGTTWIPRSSR